MNWITFTRLAVLAVLLTALCGCSTIAYYSQSIVGHTRLMLARQPIDKVISTADPGLQEKLRLAKRLRQFAVTDLALPDNKSYLSYVALDREYPVWTVVAAPEFSLDPKQWCYPVIGCASYRGYYSRQAAKEYAGTLREKGLETVVGGASAYSTLGWFADPLLPSMMRHGDSQLAETLFHELAHQQLYVNGDSAFNEAFATVVGEKGTLQWLQQHDVEKIPDYRAGLNAARQFDQLISETKQELEKLYAGDEDRLTMRASKQRVLQGLQESYERLKRNSWQGRGWFDSWFKTPLNNARLAAFSTYRDRMPAFEQLLLSCDNHFKPFFRVIEAANKRHNATIPEKCDASESG